MAPWQCAWRERRLACSAMPMLEAIWRTTRLTSFGLRQLVGAAQVQWNLSSLLSELAFTYDNGAHRDAQPMGKPRPLAAEVMRSSGRPVGSSVARKSDDPGECRIGVTPRYFALQCEGSLLRRFVRKCGVELLLMLFHQRHVFLKLQGSSCFKCLLHF
jgi:hypothetical protein